MLQKSKKILLVPNGYGRLRYIDSLSKVLVNNINSQVLITEYEGTRHTKGKLNIDNALASLKKDIKSLSNQASTRITIIAHCSALILLTKLDPKSSIWESVNKIIVYNYLANPMKSLKRFFFKAKKYDVSYDFKNIKEDIETFKSSDIENIPVPIHIIHPDTPLNKLRANDRDLKNLNSLRNISTVSKPSLGYEILDKTQSEIMETVVKSQLIPLL